ncbi:Thioredoxin-related Transmembrane protein [Nymphaea thermarum]|nr:Thioredoxin-related Transmembrane protein [Nymphaea thermarum]
MEGKTKHSFSWLNALTTEPFYLLHFLLFLSYFAFRQSASPSLSPDFSSRLLRREVQAVLAFFVFVAVKLVRDETWEAFTDNILLFAKVLLFGLASLLDYHLAFCYLAGFLVITILTQQPDHQESGHSHHLTPLQLESVLAEANTSRFWLVTFSCPWSSRCRHSSQSFADLSTIYSNQSLSFGVVDLGLFPTAADIFAIPLGVGTGQLPTYILFDNAVEIARFPDLENEYRFFSPVITKRQLCKHFDLDRRLVEYASSK